MRLLVVTQYFWPENFKINDLVVELTRRGHAVTILTGLPNYPDGEVFPQFLKNPSDFSNYLGAEVVRVPMISRGRGGFRLILNYLVFALSAAILGAWRLRGRGFDAILAYEPSPITVGIPAVVMRALKRAPLTFWVLDLWPDTLQAVGVVRSKILLQLVGNLVSFIYKRCDLILAQSRSFIPHITKYSPEGSRIVYFPNWAEFDSNVQDVQAAAEIPSEEGRFNVMFAGNIGEAQDFPAILAAAEILQAYTNIQWLIVGDGRMAAWVAEEIRRRNLQGCVHMLGRYPVDRMPSFYKHADALLVSLKDETIFSMTIPGKLQSYLAAGIPILAMLNGEGADVVEMSGSGLTCAAGDYRGLAAAVLKMATMSKVSRNEMGNNGLAVSRREFDRATLIAQFEYELGNLVKGRT